MSTIEWLLLLGYLGGWVWCIPVVARWFAPPKNHPDDSEQWLRIAMGLCVGMIWPLVLICWIVKEKVFHEQAW